MASDDTVNWNRIREAQTQLVDQFINHPDVTLIDVGYEADPTHKQKSVVLRIHVRDEWFNIDPADRDNFPLAVNSIPVVIVKGNYRPED